MPIYYKWKRKTIKASPKKKSRGYRVDGYIETSNEKIALEFLGDIYHANPNLYLSTDKPNPFKDLTAQEIQENDNVRFQHLINSKDVDKIIYVWEDDYKKGHLISGTIQ